MKNDTLDKVIVVITDVTSRIERERAEQGILADTDYGAAGRYADHGPNWDMVNNINARRPPASGRCARELGGHRDQVLCFEWLDDPAAGSSKLRLLNQRR